MKIENIQKPAAAGDMCAYLFAALITGANLVVVQVDTEEGRRSFNIPAGAWGVRVFGSILREESWDVGGAERLTPEDVVVSIDINNCVGACGGYAVTQVEGTRLCGVHAMGDANLVAREKFTRSTKVRYNTY